MQGNPSNLQLISSNLKELDGVKNSRNVIVLGGSGFIGKWIVASFATMFSDLQKNSLVNVVTRNKNATIAKFSEFPPEVRARMRFFSLEEMFANPQILKNVSGFFHCATTTSGFNSEAKGILHTTARLFDSIVEIGLSDSPPYFIHLSSGAVYRSTITDPVMLGVDLQTRELSDCLNVYQEVKVSLEKLVNEFTARGYVYGCNPRLFAFTGPWLPLTSHFAIADFMRCGNAGGPLVIQGHPETTRTYLHPVDLIIMLFYLMNEVCKGRVLRVNIGSEEEVNMGELARLISDLFGGIEIRESRKKEAKPTFYIPEMSASNEILSHKRIFNLHSALVNWKVNLARQH